MNANMYTNCFPFKSILFSLSIDFSQPFVNPSSGLLTAGMPKTKMKEK